MKENGIYISGPDLGRRVELTQPVDRGYSIVEREIMPDGPPSIEGPKPPSSGKVFAAGIGVGVAAGEIKRKITEHRSKPHDPLAPETASREIFSADKIKTVLRNEWNKKFSGYKDRFKKEEVEAELAGEIKKEEDKLKTPRPGVGMPEPEIEIDPKTGEATAGTAPEAGAAGGGDGGSEPPDDGSSTGEDAAGGGGEPPDDGEPSSGKDDGDKTSEDRKDDGSSEDEIGSEGEGYRRVEVPRKGDFTFENLKSAAEKISDLNEKADRVKESGEKLTQEEYDGVYDYLRNQRPPEWPEKAEGESDEDFKKREDAVHVKRVEFNREMDLLREALRGITGEINRVGRKSIIEIDPYARDKYEPITQEILQLIAESRDFESLNKMLDMIDLSGNDVQHSAIIGKIAEESLKVQRDSGEYKETYGYAVEYLVERLLSISDSNPEGRYHQFNFTQQQNLDSLIESVRDYDPWHYNYLKKLQTTRYVGHEMFRTRKDWKNQSEIIASYLNKRGLSFIEHDIVGTDRVQQIYEQVFGDKVQSTKTWLLEDDLVDVDKSARIIFGQDQHKIKKTVRYGVYNPATGEWDAKDAERKVEGEEKGQKIQRGMQDFEISRGYLMGRSVMTGVQRRLVYQMIGDRMPGQEGVTSLESDSIAARLAPVKFTAFRYFVGPGPVRYLRNWRDRKVKQASWNTATVERKKYEDGRVVIGPDGNPLKEKVNLPGETYGVMVSLPDELLDLGLDQNKEWGQYGTSIDSTILRDTGNQDPQSNGWRGFFMFLDHKSYKTGEVGGEKVTIGEYLRRKKLEVMMDPLDDTHYHAPDYASLGKIGDHDPNMDLSHRSEKAVFAFNERVAETIGKQRLFLGVLMRNGDLSRDNKAKIWENVSELLPSRVAAILPEHRRAIIKSVYGEGVDADKAWDQIKGHVWGMERTRVYEDAEIIKSEAQPTKNLEDYFEMLDQSIAKDIEATVRLPDEDKAVFEARLSERRAILNRAGIEAVIGKLQVLGVHNAHNFARMISPSTAFLDDVPDRGWQELGSTDLDRLFLGDQDNFEQGYGHIMGMLANPTIAPDKADEGFHEFFEKIQVTLGPSETQALVEPFIVAYYEMAKIYQKAKVVPGMRFFRKPRSQMEEVNMSSGIAMYPEDIADHLAHLAQMEVISDDPAHAIPIEKLRGKSIPGRRSLKQVIAGTKELTQLQRIKYELHASGEDIGREKARILSLTFGALLLLEMIIASLPDDAGSKLR